MPRYPAFLLDDEVEERIPLTRDTRRRAERAGIFPRRLKLSPKIRAYRLADVIEWESDPEAWAARNLLAVAEAAK